MIGSAAELKAVQDTASRICLLKALLRLGFSGISGLPVSLAGSGLVCLFSATLLALFSIFLAAVLEAWRNMVSADLCAGKFFRGEPHFFGHLAAP